MEKSSSIADVMMHPEGVISENEKSPIWPLSGAIVCLAGGTLVPLFGALLTVASWMIGDKSSGPLLHRLGTILFFLTIPLLITGGWCLDKIEIRGGKIGS